MPLTRYPYDFYTDKTGDTPEYWGLCFKLGFDLVDWLNSGEVECWDRELGGKIVSYRWEVDSTKYSTDAIEALHDEIGGYLMWDSSKCTLGLYGAPAALISDVIVWRDRS